jgi:DNA-binding response OmpR family regulator
MSHINNSVRPHVLLVEDHADIGPVLRRLMEMDGFRVTLAQCLEDAVRLCDGNKFDVLLVDLDLPDGDGLDLPRRVREVCGAPAIVFSGYSDPELREQARARGFCQYLLKPVGADVLTAAIRRAIAGGPGLAKVSTRSIGGQGATHGEVIAADENAAPSP